MPLTYLISFIDQATFSVGSFLLSIGLVRPHGAAEYGGYGIAHSIVLTGRAIQSQRAGRSYALVTLTSGAVTLAATYPLVSHFAAYGAVLACLLGYAMQTLGAAVLAIQAQPPGALTRPAAPIQAPRRLLGTGWIAPDDRRVCT